MTLETIPYTLTLIWQHLNKYLSFLDQMVVCSPQSWLYFIFYLFLSFQERWTYRKKKKKVSSPIMCKSSDGSSDSQNNRETIKVFVFKICITKLKFLKSTLTGLSHREYFILEEMTCNDQLFCFSETSMVLVSQCLFTSLWFVTNILPRRLVE